MRNPQYQQFRAKLKAYRKDLGLTQRGLAEKLGIAYNTYQQIELGFKNPSKAFFINFLIITETLLSDWLSIQEQDYWFYSRKTGSVPHSLIYQISKLTQLGKKRLELYIEANIDQLNEC
jgi:transcriptional regulator with XRE-family HTH domain